MNFVLTAHRRVAKALPALRLRRFLVPNSPVIPPIPFSASTCLKDLFFDLIPFHSIACALFSLNGAPHPSSFPSVAHSLPRNGGWGSTPDPSSPGFPQGPVPGHTISPASQLLRGEVLCDNSIALR